MIGPSAPWRLLRSIPLFAPYADALDCTPLGHGEINGIWRVRSPAGDHVARLLCPDMPPEARQRVCRNTKIAAAAGLAPAVLHVDEGHGIVVTAHHGGDLHTGAFDDQNRLDQAADLYRRLHGGEAFQGTFCPFGRLARLAARSHDLPLPQVADRTALLDALILLEDRLRADAPPLAPCHNDPGPHALIDSPDGLYLIDWADAAMADPDWEVGAFCLQTALTPDQEARFLRAMVGAPDGWRAWRAKGFQAVLRGIHAFQALLRTTDPTVDPDHWQTQAAGHFDDLRRRLATLPPRPEPPALLRATQRERATIFVSIASYRDPDCQNTVADLFAKARHPDRVRVGICWQAVPEEDGDCLGTPPPRPEQVRVQRVHARDSRGACWARAQVQALWQGEDYVFQIDSHMRFVEGWDDVLLSQLALCPSDKPVLSTYPLAFTPPDTFQTPALVRIHAKGFDLNGVLMLGSRSGPFDARPRAPLSSPFVAGGMLFAPAAAMAEVPYDPHLYFQGEEISLAARLYTHGWDVFIPSVAVAWHDYGKRPERPRHWRDVTDWGTLNARSFSRLRHLLGMDASTDPLALKDLDRHGLGEVRSLADFERFSRLRFRDRLIDGQAVALPADAPQTETQAQERRAMFAAIWRNNAWQEPETRSGRFATLAATAEIRAALPGLLRELGVDSMADAGCGDMHWLSDLSANLRFYVGVDIVPDAIAELTARFADRPGHFFRCADVVMDTMPPCDAILCRDVLTHLPTTHAVAALRRFQASGARWLIATTHFKCPSNPWIRTGGWYPMTLLKPPFSLPPPLHVLNDGDPTWGKALGVWDFHDRRLRVAGAPPGEDC